MRDPLGYGSAGWLSPRGIYEAVSADSGRSLSYARPMAGSSLSEPVTGPEEPEKKLSIHFNTEVLGETPLARLSVNREDQEYQVTYPMSKIGRRDEVQNAVTGIQRRYAEQAVLTARPQEPEDIRPPAEKEPEAPFVDQVAELLCYQEALEIATTLDEATVYDESEAKRQSQFRDKLNGWYTDGLRMIRDQLRNHSNGLAFVRGLLRSEKEIQVDMGIRLAREESIRPALQGDLVRVFLNAALSPQLRQRAFSYLRTEIRQDPGAGAGQGQQPGQ